MILRPALASVLALAVLACAGRPREGGAQPPVPKREGAAADTGRRDGARAEAAFAPLARFASQRVIVLPALYLRAQDSLGWSSRVGDPAQFLGALDDELAFALGERGLRTMWVFPEALARAARRNPGYVPDAHAVSGEPLRPPARQKMNQIPEPLASQLRSLVALSDGRYALIPVEVRFERLPDGTGRAILHLVLADARTAQPVWTADVPSDPAAAPTPALGASIAGRVANLVVTPP